MEACIKAMCESSYTTEENGELFDPNGSGTSTEGYYSCFYTIDPECAARIVITFDEFSMSENSNIKIYDGSSTEDEVILEHSGNELPDQVVAKSGSAMIYYENIEGPSDFKLNWF